MFDGLRNISVIFLDDKIICILKKKKNDKRTLKLFLIIIIIKQFKIYRKRH